MPYKYYIIFFLVSMSFQNFSAQAQNKEIKNDTTTLDSTKFHSPKTATIMSAIIPGLGQVYNKKYWKVPLVYVGFGVIGYSIMFYGDNYKKFQTAYIYRMDNDPATIDSIYTNYPTQNIKIIKDSYRRNRDLSIIFGVIWYVLNVLDATVDAHLYDFNINDDLSFKVNPSTLPLYYKNTASTIPGLTLSFNIGRTNKSIKPKINL